MLVPERMPADRLSVGVALGVAVVILAVLGGWAWVAFVAGVVYLSFGELQHMFVAKGFRASKIIVLLTAAALIGLAAFHKTRFFLPTLTVGVLLVFLRLLFRQPRASIADIGATFLAMFYIGFMPVHFILLRNLSGETIEPTATLFAADPGLGYLMFTCAVISVGDIVAYYAGQRFGKTPLSPDISPKKTKEGAIIGTVLSIATGVALSSWVGIPRVHSAILALLVTVMGQYGDLAESLLKRDAGVKDSGDFFLSHGGVLDRMDSYIFSGVVAYYYIHWVLLKEGFVHELLL